MDIIEISIPFDQIDNEAYIKQTIARKTGIQNVAYYKIHRRSIDSRRGKPKFQLKVLISKTEIPTENYKELIDEIPKLKGTTSVVIIGAGPAGYFAALECLRQGLKPIILERGKDVRARRRDLKAIQQDGIVNPHSNYCFGEGGAGTYSDGKLYTRSHKRGKIENVLQILVAHGAKEDILIDAHPHIGSNKLPGIVTNIRNTIERKGGEVHFDTFVTNFSIQNAKIEAVGTADGKEFKADAFILATGHSARDIYQLLQDEGVRLERKPFALGVRIEHPQPLIDEIQYRQKPRSPLLPASSYKVVRQIDGKGVFSFCMCPGGLVVPSATEPGEIVVNGMSLSRRDSPFANSGVVTEVSKEELVPLGYDGVFGNLLFQKEVEQNIFKHSDGSQKAPAMNLQDFVDGKIKSELKSTSYIPGLIEAPLHEILPKFIYERIRKGVLAFDKKLSGYFTSEANVIAVESRTSSPIRIPRDIESFQHPEVSGLYPCGEGAGFAGGILSAAMDGQNVARKVAAFLS